MDGITVEWCCTTRSPTAEDRVEAEAVRRAALPPLADTAPPVEVLEPIA